MYAELHCHTNYSFQEGASSVGDLLVRAEGLGYRALAITDHDNLCGSMEFARAAADLDLNAIIGAEVTLLDGSHLTLLAENQNGYANLSRLVSHGYTDRDRRNPGLDPARIAEHAEGLILLTGCRTGRLADLADRSDLAGAEAQLSAYMDWCGPDNVFVELQQNLVQGDTHRNRRLVNLAGRLGAGVVATNNVHYHVQDRHRLQDALVAVHHNKSLEESHRERRPNGHFYLKSPEEMAALFDGCPEAIENTLRIAERCSGFDLTRDLGYHFPDYPAPQGHTAQTYLRELCYEAAQRRYHTIDDRVAARLERELDLVEKNGLAGFFLIYHDIILLAREIMIELGLSDPEIPLEERPPGRGRGSSVAMLIGYLIGLSHIDPLEFDLSLDRFLNDDMDGSVPDIDLDFPRNIREELIKRVHQEWGPDRAVLTGMISTYKIKGAIRDMGKALGLPAEDLGKLAKRVDSHHAGNLDEEMKALPEFRDRTDAPVWRDLIDLARQLDGFPKYLAQHPGGMILSSSPLTDQVPVQPSAMEGRYICHWDKDSIDDAGFVKIDFLALGALSQMQRALQLIEERTGHYIDLSRIDFEDRQVYESLHRADTIGIFQVESAAQMQTITRIKPVNLTDMAYEVGAVRPGVGVNDGVSQFIKRRTQGIPWDYDHPLEERALKRTLGIILFQDQVNRVAMDVAGFSAQKANKLRLTFNRRNNVALIERYRKDFMEGASANGVTEEVAGRIFEKFNGHYMFPEAHAFAFGATAYHMSWLKYYYPLEFFVGIFNEQPMGFYNLETLKEDARRHDVTVLNPDINASLDRSIIHSHSGPSLPISAEVGDTLKRRAPLRPQDAAHPLNHPPDPLPIQEGGRESIRGGTPRPPHQRGAPSGHLAEYADRGHVATPPGAASTAQHAGELGAPHIDAVTPSDQHVSELGLPHTGVATPTDQHAGDLGVSHTSAVSPPDQHAAEQGLPHTGAVTPTDQHVGESRGGEPPLAGDWGEPPDISSPFLDRKGARGMVERARQHPTSEQSRHPLPPKDGAGQPSDEALLLGFLNVKGVGQAAAEAIVEARKRGGPFTSLADAMRRTGLQRENMESLVMAGAFSGLVADRRAAMWEIGLRYRPSNGQQSLDLPVEQDMARLPGFTDWEEMAGEYRTMGIYPEGHLIAKLRPHLGPEVVPSDEVPHLRDGREVTVIGLVIRRQRPLAKAVFLTLEDEFGHTPIVVWPKTYERYRLVLREPLLKVRGTVSRREGTLNIVLTHAEELHGPRDLPDSRSWR
jgi:error-prone DNA polymerase